MKPYRHSIAIRDFYNIFAIFAVLVWVRSGVGQDAPAQDESPPPTISQVEIKQLVEQLSSNRHAERENATEKLIQAGPNVIQTLLNHWPDSNLECQYRMSRVLQSIVPQIDYDQHAEQLAALIDLKNSTDKKLAAIADQLIGAEPEPELAKELKSAIDRVLSGEKGSVPISNELIAKLENSEAFQIVRRRPLFNQDPNSHWRTIQNSEAHQEILLYRIQWFNGNWSGWLLSGVNDINKQLNRQHWNCFYDHKHEFIKIRTRAGNLSRRRGYLPKETQHNVEVND